MEVKLLEENYLSNKDIQKDFINDTIDFDAEYFSNETIYLNNPPFFPIYMAKGKEEEKINDYKLAVKAIKDYYIDTPREIHMNGRFWHSFLLYNRDEIMKNYGKDIKSGNGFYNIVFRKFDWENYIYKCVLMAEYITDVDEDYGYTDEEYVELFVKNLDLLNYILKYPLFRNSDFVIKFFVAIDELKIFNLLKKKLPSDNKDEDLRYGRLVFQEFNNNYPVVMAPFLSKDELKREIINSLLRIMPREERAKYFKRRKTKETNTKNESVRNESMLDKLRKAFGS